MRKRRGIKAIKQKLCEVCRLDVTDTGYVRFSLTGVFGKHCLCPECYQLLPAKPQHIDIFPPITRN